MLSLIKIDFFNLFQCLKNLYHCIDKYIILLTQRQSYENIQFVYNIIFVEAQMKSWVDTARRKINYFQTDQFENIDCMYRLHENIDCTVEAKGL